MPSDPCSIFSNGGNVFSWTINPMGHFVKNTLRNNHAKFTSRGSSSFRGKNFFFKKFVHDDEANLTYVPEF